MDSPAAPSRTGFWFRWMLASTVGYAFGSLLGFVLGHFILGNVAIGVGIGALTGFLQWRVLRRYVEGVGAWIWAGAIGLPVGLGLLAAASALWDYPFDLGWPHGTVGWALAFALGGALTGLIQKRALYLHDVEVARWVWISMIAWGSSLFPQAIPADMSGGLPVILLIFRNGLLAPALAGLVLGAISGAGLVQPLSTGISNAPS